MLSFFGGGFDALRTPLMTRGDEHSVEESKVLDPGLVDTNDSGRINPRGDTGRSSIMQAVTQMQCGDADAQDWGAEVLNHVLVHILDKDQVETSATNDFTVFVIANGIDNMCLLLTVLKDCFKSMGYDIDLKTLRTLQALNKMHNEQVSDAMSKDDKNMWFLDLEKQTVMCYMMCETKLTAIPSATGVTTPNVPLGQSNSNKAKLETAWQSSLAMYNVGKLLLAPMPMASNVNCRVTFGPTMAASNLPATMTIPAPTVATTALAVTRVMVPVAALAAAPTAMYLTSCAVEFDKGDDDPLATTACFRIVSGGQSGIMLSWVMRMSTSVSKSWIQATSQILMIQMRLHCLNCNNDLCVPFLLKCWLKTRLPIFCVSTQIHKIK